jgi:hypothetical protein
MVDLNIDLWWGMSEGLAETIESLLHERMIHQHPSTLLVYAIDGGIPKMPIAKSLRKYKSPRWLPVTFQSGERCDGCN